jgi:hypothetical protein
VFLRIQPYNLPGTEDLARNQIINTLNANIQTTIKQQYPNLPQQELEQEVIKQRTQLLKDNNIEPYVQQQSQQIKNFYQDNNGNTYLLGIDPYHHYQLAEWQSRTGKQGEVIDGVVKNPLMQGRTKKVTVYYNIHASVETFMYKIGKVFNKKLTLMQTAFFAPIPLMLLTTLIFFFIGKKVSNNVFGGFITATIIACHQGLLSRTIAGFSDTDMYNALLPGLAILLFLYSLNYEGWKKHFLITLTGITISTHHMIWGGWWYTLAFILFSCCLTALVDFKKSLSTTLTLLLSTTLSSTIFGVMAGYWWSYGAVNTFKSLYKLPLEFVRRSLEICCIQFPLAEVECRRSINSLFSNPVFFAGFHAGFFSVAGLLARLETDPPFRP